MTQQLTTTPIPRKLNQGMITALSTAIAKGNYAVTACSLCGISEPTFYDWLELGAKELAKDKPDTENIYLRLVKSLKRAESQAEDELVQVVRESATVKREWLPAMTFLERRHPDRWGRKDRTRVDINERKTITITHVEVVLDRGDGQTYIEGEIVKEGLQGAIEQGEG